MPETNLAPSNEDLERQIAALADAAFAETEPVRLPDRNSADARPGRAGLEWGNRLALVAAVVLVATAIGAFAWVFGRPAMTTDPVGDSQQRQRTVADDGSGDSDAQRPPPPSELAPELLIDDPLAINLDELIAASSQNAIGLLDEPITTIGFDALPEGWQVVDETVDMARHFSGKPSVLHFITLDGPGPLRATVNIDAAWEPNVVKGNPSFSGEVEQIELGDTIAVYDLNRLYWKVNDRLVVDLFVMAESGVANTEEEMVELAQAMTVVERQLTFDVVDTESGASLADRTDPLVAGRINDVPWTVFPDGDWLQLGYGLNLNSLGLIEEGPELVSLASELDDDGSRPRYEVRTGTAQLPDGTIWFGTVSEPDVTLVVAFENGEAVIPTAPFESGSAFAIPLDRRLDPIEVIFTGADGERLLMEIIEDHVGPIRFDEP